MLLYGTVARMRYRTEPCHTLTHGTYAKVSYILTTSLLLRSLAFLARTSAPSSYIARRLTTVHCLVSFVCGPDHGAA